MTAEIGLLNKSAVVLAADSAVTIGHGNRVYNNANKLYELKYCNHIGIMVYNNANIMGIPVETIIKLYSKELKSPLRYLKDYIDDFIRFVNDFLIKHVKSEQITEKIEALTYLTLDAITESAIETANEQSNLSKKDFKNKVHEIHNDIVTFILEDLEEKEIQSEFTDYSINEFKKDHNSIIDKVVDLHENYNELKFDKKFKDSLKKILYLDSIKKLTDEDDFSGIVIAGFGEDEIYPGYAEILVGDFLRNNLKWTLKRNSSINNETTVIVRPFAQRDMSDTFFRGIDHELYLKIVDSLEKEYESIQNFLHKNIRLTKAKKELISEYLIKSINNINDQITETSKTEYINPIVDTIESFRKEDLIEIAESLISITSLKRKTSSNIQSVGGPVDIAVITKGDGFVWIKAKHLKIK
jgi:hypothetical protein